MKEKIVLKGTLKEKLEQLDNRETELLKEINRLNNVIQTLNEKFDRLCEILVSS